MSDDEMSSSSPPSPIPTTSSHLTTYNNHADLHDINQTDLVRLMIQSLQHLGYNSIADQLEKQSGIALQSTEVNQFCMCIHTGDWTKAEQLMPHLHIIREPDVSAIRFLIYSQKYLEFLEQKKLNEALQCLRMEVAPLRQPSSKLHKLTALLMCTDVDEMKAKARWAGKDEGRKGLMSAIRAYVSPSILPPPYRLPTLLRQAIELQTTKCLYHNEASDTHTSSLFTDHMCDRNQIPRETAHILTRHNGEVWFIKFSPDGKRLASTGQNNKILIWDAFSPSFTLLKTLPGHPHEVISYVSWSSNSQKLLSCADDGTVRVWNVEDGTCLKEFKNHQDAVTACAFLPDGQTFISGSNDRTVVIQSLSGNVIHQFSVARVNDLAVTSDGLTLVVVCQEKKIRIFSLVDKSESSIPIVEAMTSVSISSDNRYILANVASVPTKATETQMWDIQTKILVQKFRGQKQSRFFIRSCFGGFGDSFVISGSEDNHIYIWHREHGTLLETLEGHTKTINCVAWNPVNPYMIASASDDHSIRIWLRTLPSPVATTSPSRLSSLS